MLTIRPETPEDNESIRFVNEQAFGQSEEAELIEKLRNRGAIILSLVAIRDNDVVGHIAFTPVVIESEDLSFKAIALGPMSVLPIYQRQGIGGQLVHAGLMKCRNLGHDIVVVIGHPTYYSRFGFIAAKTKGIVCEFEVPEEAFMVMELREEALVGRRGIVKFQPEFHTTM